MQPKSGSFLGERFGEDLSIEDNTTKVHREDYRRRVLRWHAFETGLISHPRHAGPKSPSTMFRDNETILRRTVGRLDEVWDEKVGSLSRVGKGNDSTMSMRFCKVREKPPDLAAGRIRRAAPRRASPTAERS